MRAGIDRLERAIYNYGYPHKSFEVSDNKGRCILYLASHSWFESNGVLTQYAREGYSSGDNKKKPGI